jgi:hypothetical protein
MDQLMETAGATPLDWPHKTECCGASFSITDSSIVLELSDQILAMAQAAGADCIATACPLCQLNLDMRQKDIEANGSGAGTTCRCSTSRSCWAWRWAARRRKLSLAQPGGGAARTAGSRSGSDELRGGQLSYAGGTG